MNANEYQKWTRTVALYPKEKFLEYTLLGLLGEAGEVANKAKKVFRGDYELDEEIKEKIKDEVGDCVWYIARLLDDLGYSLEEVFEHNKNKLESRKERGVLKGSGDNR